MNKPSDRSASSLRISERRALASDPISTVHRWPFDLCLQRTGTDVVPVPHFSIDDQAAWRFTALDLPRWSFSKSYDKRCSLSSVFMPAASTAEM